ncbi:MAG: triphosphoribosyl-dephospho-CoA synthase [Candidatus Bathyarchaeota archaeon]|nr:triphosphoribosyl-dephospho-CoA synthase [Candidatus Bathyarchaeota archaeon]
MPPFDKAKHVSKCLQTAILFEVTSNKPGNVTPTTGFEGTRIEHFLASAVAAQAAFEEAAKRGVAVFEGKLEISQVGVGELIKTCVADIAGWQRGGNTLLGPVMLFVPLASAAGMTSHNEKGEFDVQKLRANLKLTAESTTSTDAVCLYEAIDIAQPSGLNEAPELDVKDSASKQRLLNEKVSLFDVLKLGKGYDDVSYEWVTNFAITFELAYPYLWEQLKTQSVGDAVLQGSLKILSQRPDTFIARKAGKEKACQVSADAQEILRLGGTDTPDGKAAIAALDQKLRQKGNSLNPGTTADLTAAALALCMLRGYRP